MHFHADAASSFGNDGAADNVSVVLFHQQGVLFRDDFESGDPANWDARAGGL